MSLKHVYSMVQNISNTTKRLEKEAFIKEYVQEPDFVKVIKLAHDPFKLYKTTRLVYNPNDANIRPNLDKAFKKLDEMAISKGTSNDDIYELGCLSSIDQETFNIFHGIVNKDLKTCVGNKIWKKYIDIPVHEVMLCSDDLDRFLKEVKNKFEDICWSIKKDGVRVWAVIQKNGDVIYTSRNGKKYNNFNKFNERLVDLSNRIKTLNNKLTWPVIFDGEIISKDNNFQSLAKEFKRETNVKDDIFQFAIFDYVPTNSVHFKSRYDHLSKIMSNNHEKNEIYLLPHYFGHIKSREDIETISNRVINVDKEEGIVLKNINSPYEFKRSVHWCKVKLFHTLDLKVVRTIMGKGKYKQTLGAFVVDYNGKEVTVGSGISDEDRDYYLKNPPTMIEVRYQESTADGSLRFPTFVRERDDK